jgi:hypothetical protein
MLDHRRSLIFLIATVTVVGANLPPLPAAPAPPIEYVFVPVADMPANFDWGGTEIHVGTIDARGNFHLRKKVSKLEVWKARHFDYAEGTGSYKFPEPVRVYEFRSGRLILGTMRPDGEFIPEAGSTVRKLEDYKYGQDYVIWNLPGYFKKKDAPEGGKPEKK